jgi:hypothetical protein
MAQSWSFPLSALSAERGKSSLRPLLSGGVVRRGELYRVYKASARDPKKHRIFVVVSRQVLIDSRFSTVLTDFIATLSFPKIRELDKALAIALDLTRVS